MKELMRWKEYDVFQEVPNNGENTIETRWVITEKSLQEGNRVTKARLVAKGFQEPSKESIRKDSPTALKTSLRLATTFIASQGWDVKSFDISAAFLQGEEIGRKILIKPPPEAKSDGLWLLRKPVYGLVDAPRKFYLQMRKELTHLGMVQSKADPALFFWRLKGKLHGVVSAHPYIINRKICVSVCATVRYLLPNGESFRHAFFCKGFSDDVILPLYASEIS